MEMIDGDERDDKIIAVARHDMSVNYLNDISELPPHTLVETKKDFSRIIKCLNDKKCHCGTVPAP